MNLTSGYAAGRVKHGLAVQSQLVLSLVVLAAVCKQLEQSLHHPLSLEFQCV